MTEGGMDHNKSMAPMTTAPARTAALRTCGAAACSDNAEDGAPVFCGPEPLPDDDEPEEDPEELDGAPVVLKPLDELEELELDCVPLGGGLALSSLVSMYEFERGCPRQVITFWKVSFGLN